MSFLLPPKQRQSTEGAAARQIKNSQHTSHSSVTYEADVDRKLDADAGRDDKDDRRDSAEFDAEQTHQTKQLRHDQHQHHHLHTASKSV